MTQEIFTKIPLDYFQKSDPKQLQTVEIAMAEDAAEVLQKANNEWGLALTSDEVKYLAEAFKGF